MNKTLSKVKKYWNKRPCNVGHSKKKFLTKEYFDEVKKKKILCRKAHFKVCKFP